MIKAFKILKVNEIHLEHCSLHYRMLDVFKNWQFDGRISLGVIDQRIDNTETEEDIINAIKPALDYFPKEKILLTSECGFWSCADKYLCEIKSKFSFQLQKSYNYENKCKFYISSNSTSLLS